MVDVSMLMGFKNQLCYRSGVPCCSFPCIVNQIYSYYMLLPPIYVLYHLFWLVVSTPLKNMISSVGMITFPTYGKSKKSMVPNHQPVLTVICAMVYTVMAQLTIINGMK